jgi:glycosyltransferase involved in cell wall biosynthesis
MVSVALCTFNAEAFVREQVSSIISQTSPPAELVVVDDASTDGTVGIVESLAASAPFPIRIERQTKNVGWVANATRAVELCRGPWVALSDHDDIWLPAKLERQLEQLGPQIHLVFHDAEIVSHDGQKLGRRTISAEERAQLRSGKTFEALVRYNLVQGATMLFRRADFEWVLPIPQGVSFDAYLALCLAGAGVACFVDEPLLYYRQHGRNLLGAETRRGLSKWIARGAQARAKSATHLHSQLDKYVAARSRLEGRARHAELTALDSKVSHLERRASLPHQRWRRLVPVARELLDGHYHRLARGIFSAARDLLV